MTELPFVPGAWEGQPAFLIGGGPSLKGFDFSRLRRPGRRVLAINSAFTVAPWADMLFFADHRWFVWNRSRLRDFKGPMFTRSPLVKPDLGMTIFRLHRENVQPLSRNPYRIAGWCSGGCAVNLAFHLRPSAIILLGYDMDGAGNWHDMHQQPGKPAMYPDQAIPKLNAMAVELKKEGVTVFNANPNSALKCFPFIDLEEALASFG